MNDRKEDNNVENVVFEYEVDQRFNKAAEDDQASFQKYIANAQMYDETKFDYKNMCLMGIDFRNDANLQLTRRYSFFKTLIEQAAELFENDIDDLEYSYYVFKKVKGNTMGFPNCEIVEESDEIHRRAAFNKKNKKNEKRIARNKRLDQQARMRLKQHYEKKEVRDDDTRNHSHLKEEFHPTGCFEVIRTQAIKLNHASEEIKRMEKLVYDYEVKMDEMSQVVSEYNKLKPRIISTFKTMNYKFNEFTNGVWFAACGAELNFDDIFNSLEAFATIRSKHIELNKTFGYYKESNIDDRYFREYEKDYDDEEYVDQDRDSFDSEY